MKNIQIIEDIFEKTKEIIKPLWLNQGAKHTENPQISHVLYYLSLTAGYLKSKEEAEVFQHQWNKIKESLKEGSDEQDWLNQSKMINSHLEQALLEEGVHNPNATENIGIASFYENNFSELHKGAKTEYEKFQKQKNNMVKAMQDHYKDVHSSPEKWLAALRRGDPAAFCD